VPIDSNSGEPDVCIIEVRYEENLTEIKNKEKF
jgi:hypothetical protein